MSAPVIVPDGQHVVADSRGLVIRGEYSRPITVTCQRCGTTLALRLCADELLPDAECDNVLEDYLRGLGWAPARSEDDDLCPRCKPLPTGATEKAWQRGYPMEYLTATARRFCNEHCASRFSRIDEACVAEGLESGTLTVGPWGCVIATEAKVATAMYAYHDTLLARKQPGDVVVAAFSTEQPVAMAEHLRELANRGPAVWCWVWQECEAQRRVVERAGYKFVGGKINAFGEIRGLWFGEPPSLMPRPLPELHPTEYLGIAQTSLGLDPAAAAAEVMALPAKLYANHYSRYNEGRTWSALALRGYTDDPKFIIKPAEMSKKWRAEHAGEHYELQDTWLRRVLPACDALAAPLTSIAELHRFRLMRLLPGGGELTRHSDLTDNESGIADGRVARFHIPLITNPGVRFTSWDMRGREHHVTMRAGSCWYLDTRKPHAAVNNGFTERIHLVADVVSNPAVRALLEEATT